MRKALLLAGLSTLAVVSSAQTYRWDSGVSDNSVGLTAGGDIAWLQTFTVTGGFSHITGIQTCFGTPAFAGSSGVTAGQSYRVFVWKGTPTGTGVDTPTLLATGNGTVAAGSIDTDVLQNVAVNATISGTSNFFIGADINGAAGGFPAPLQQTAATGFPIMPNSWVAGNTTAGGFDPNNLSGGIGLFQNSQIGLAGNWLLRATATNPAPEPASMAALGLGAIVLLRRRRKA